MNNTKAPYNVSSPTASLALAALAPASITQFRRNITTLLENRAFLLDELPKITGVGEILGGNHANFLLVQILNKNGKGVDNARAKGVYTRLAEREGVVVRFRGNEIGCEGCLRITVGTREECEAVLGKLSEVLSE